MSGTEIDLHQITGGMTVEAVGNSLAATAESSHPIKVSKVVFFGASIFEDAFSGYEQLVSSAFSAHGLSSVSVDVSAVSGSNLDGALVRFNSIKSAYALQSSTLFVIHTLGNDVTANRPFSGLSDSQIAAIYKKLTDLTNAIDANGNQWLLVSTTFRNYEQLAGRDPLGFDEEDGSKPFNALVDRASKPNSVSWNGKNAVNPYFIAKQNASFLIDGVHYTVAGSSFLRNYIVSQVAKRIRGDYTQTGFDCSAHPQRAYVTIGVGSSKESTRTAGMLRLQDNSTDPIQLLAHLSARANSIYAQINITGSGVQTYPAGVQTGQNEGLHLQCSDARSYASHYTTSTAFVDVLKITGLNPDQEFCLNIAAYRNTTATDSIRLGQYSVDNGASFIELNASTFDQSNNGASPTGLLSGKADENGHVTLKMRAKSAGNYAYFSAFEIIPL